MRTAIIFVGLALTGCGAVVPNTALDGDDQLFVTDVHSSIQCEIFDAVKEVDFQAEQLSRLRKTNVNFFDNWAVLYTVTLTTIEDTNATPSIDLLTPTTPANLLLPGDLVFTLNTGIGIKAKATKTESSQKFFLVRDLREANRCEDMIKNKIVPIGNTLGIKGWALRQLALVDSGLTSPKTPKESFTYEMKFEIEKRANVDPKWSFTRREFSKATGLFNTGRKTNHSIVISLGPADPSRVLLEVAASNLHNARLFANAIEE